MKLKNVKQYKIYFVRNFKKLNNIFMLQNNIFYFKKLNS